ncbi:MAG: hypothetical protein BGN88_07665 [Clostridiales bacterium 43-6]|nr:MAG: hypothetical protein BGN88_07665 [Clostridiales bacterium 43-6]
MEQMKGSNDLMFLERSMSDSGAWVNPDEKLQRLKDTVAARKLNISLAQYRHGLKIIENTQKEFAKIFSKRIRDRLGGGNANRAGERSNQRLIEGAGSIGLDSDILIDSYKNMRNNPDVIGQSHHLNQDAAFRDVIPKNDGLCVELEGNAFRDVGSPHYSAHENLESFWNNFRSKGDLYGDTPKISDYNSALYDSLRAAGLSDAQAKVAVQNAAKQQLQYGFSE